MTQAFNLSQLANNVNTSGQLNAAAGLYNQVPVANGGTGLSTATGALVGAGATISAVAAGTVNNVLTSNGTTWVSATSQGGPAPVVTIYTSPSPWTKSPALKGVKVTVVGGGGGAVNFAPGGKASGGGGGGAGIGFFPAPSIAGPLTITVGSGGTGGTGSPSVINPGTSGNSSSFGAMLTATGGAGSTSAAGQVYPIAIGGTVTPSPTILGINGQPGFSITSSYQASADLIGNGGNVGFGLGFGGNQVAYSSPSYSVTINNPTIGYGGGGGAVTRVPTNPPGQNGAAGVVIVEEFY